MKKPELLAPAGDLLYSFRMSFQLEQSGHLFRGQKEQEFGSASTLL